MLSHDRHAHRAMLRHVGLFSSCTDKELDRVGQLTTTAEVEAGVVVCRQGHSGNQSFFIIDGDAEVSIDGRPIAWLGQGSFFGEMSVLEGTPRVATVVAQTPMTLLVSTHQELVTLIADVPPVGRRMLSTMSSRLRSADRALAGVRAD